MPDDTLLAWMARATKEPQRVLRPRSLKVHRNHVRGGLAERVLSTGKKVVMMIPRDLTVDDD
jgi:hypothetical protein